MTPNPESKALDGPHAFAYLVVGLVSTAYSTWAIWLMWGWFMRPFGLPAITYFHAMGLDMLFTLFSPSVQADLKPEEFDGYLTKCFIKTTMLLLMAWIAHSLM